MQSTHPNDKTASILENILTDPQTLATLGAASAVCDHPAAVLLPILVVSDMDPEPVQPATPAVWCALCGAIGPRPGNTAPWTRPTIAQRITREKIQDVESLAFGLAEVCKAIDRIKPYAQSAAVCDVLRAAVRELVASPALAGSEPIAAALKALGP
jgi:hypothetical protein